MRLLLFLAFLFIATLGFSQDNPYIAMNRNLKVDFKIFPNPATSDKNITISFNEAVEIKQLEIFDLLGTPIFELERSRRYDKKISIRTLKKGIFLVRLRTSKGSATKKLVVK